ncbi:MAG: zinc ABC transporter substrate-binding protein [Ruminococcaceae bacterium]|nr:zinc ABC transporter substrate-binding protein [Oscillospiraceae bacterium]
MKKSILVLLCILLCLPGCGAQTEPQESDTLRIVATVFPAYDFARAAAGEGAEVKLLLPPGTESHSYEPTPADILAVQSCDLFLCLGGESEAWVETILAAVEPQGEVLRMVDCVELLPEEHTHGEEEHDHSHDHDPGAVVGMDEHVWTAPENAAEITRKVGETLAALDGANAAQYRENAAAYAAKLETLDEAFEDFFAARPDRTIVFGDRFPLRYFAEAYDLDYYAAFPSCSTQTEPSAATIAFLTEKVREENLSTVWYIEFSNHLVADSIAEAAGADTAMFHTCHNVSGEEIESGATYLSLMEGNLATLREKFS